jgi:hypothetical protein
VLAGRTTRTAPQTRLDCFSTPSMAQIMAPAPLAHYSAEAQRQRIILDYFNDWPNMAAPEHLRNLRSTAIHLQERVSLPQTLLHMCVVTKRKLDWCQTVCRISAFQAKNDSLFIGSLTPFPCLSINPRCAASGSHHHIIL